MFYLSPQLTLHLKSVRVDDQHKQNLVSLDNLYVNLIFTDFNEKIHLRDIRARGLDASFIKYHNEQDFNYQFLIDYFANSDTSSIKVKKSVPFLVDNLILEESNFRYWNQDIDIKPLQTMNYADLRVSDINLHLSDFILRNDSIFVDIRNIKAKEASGFDLEFLSTNATICSYSINCDNLRIKTKQTQLNCDFTMQYEDYSDFLDFNNKIYMLALIDSTELNLADLACFDTTLADLSNLMTIKGYIEGYVRDFKANDFSFSFGNNTNFIGDISMKGLPYFYTCHNELSIRNMSYSYDDLVQFNIPYPEKHIPIPASLKPLGKGNISGDFIGSYYNFYTRLNLSSEVGNAKVNLAFDSETSTQAQYTAEIALNKFEYNVFTDSSLHEKLDLQLNCQGEGVDKEFANLNFDANIKTIDALGTQFNDIKLNGDFNNQKLNAQVNINDKKLLAEAATRLDISQETPVLEVDAKIKKANLQKMNLVKSNTNVLLSTALKGEISGFDISTLTAHVIVDTTIVENNEGRYVMNNFKADLIDDPYLSRKANINCDFFDMDMGGNLLFSTFISSIKKLIDNYLEIPEWHLASDNSQYLQDLYMTLNLRNTNTLTQLLMPELEVAPESKLVLNFSPQTSILGLTLSSELIKYNNFEFKKILISNNSDAYSLKTMVKVDNIMLNNNVDDSLKMGIDKLNVNLVMSNDSLRAYATWNDDEQNKHNNSFIDALFTTNIRKGNTLNILASNVIINDSSWQIKQGSSINFKKNIIKIKDFEIRCGNQFLSINGIVPSFNGAALAFDIKDFNISNLNILTQTQGYYFGGVVNGNFEIENIKNNTTFMGNLRVNNLTSNNNDFGDALVVSKWNNNEASLFVNTQLVSNEGDSTLALSGYYYPRKIVNSLNFNLSLNQMKLDFVEMFTSGLTSNIKGFASGDIAISGNVDTPIIEGSLMLDNVHCKVDILNTDVNFSHRVAITQNEITFNDLRLYDTNGNQALSKGRITHNNFDDFYFDISILPNKFLAMNTTSVESPYFYGSVFATGRVDIIGPLDDIALNINVRNDAGTKLTIPSDYVSTISENNYIVFVNHDIKNDSTLLEPESTTIKKEYNYSININADVTNYASVNIILPQNLGNLDANGSGRLRMEVNSLGDFTLIGDYNIESGKFSFSPNAFINKNFDLMDGGLISWTGNPFEAGIDVNGFYKAKAPISSIGVAVDSTSTTSSNINVNCIINLSGMLLNPDINFRFELPNASEDIRQTVFNTIDTTSQSIMLEQTLSLLLFNTFSNSNIVNTNIVGSGINVLTNQINSWLSQISNNVDINFHYSPSSNFTSQEVEVALKTELFNDRLTIEGNLGMISPENNAQNYNNIVGDATLTWKITSDGRLRATGYTHSNTNTNYYNYTYENYYPYTQGVGIFYTRDFDKFREIFRFNRKNKNKNNEQEEIDPNIMDFNDDEFKQKIQGL